METYRTHHSLAIEEAKVEVEDIESKDLSQCWDDAIVVLFPNDKYETK